MKRATALDPENVEAHDSLGTAYFKTGDREKAMEELSIALRLDPKFQGELRKLLT
jgi:Flp pilus assembly protein TadD